MSSQGAKLEETNLTTLGKQWASSEYPKKSILLYDAENDRYILAQADTNGYLYVNAIIPGVIAVDVIDRWARELGQIDLALYLGVACGPANPIDVQPGAGVVFDVSDRWARELGQIDLAMVLGAALTPANPVISGIFDAAGNRMPSMDICARAGYTQTCFGGAVIDPRNIRALIAADIVTVQSITQWGGVALTGRDISGDLQALIDDSIKGVMRTLGDAGATPANQTGETVLKRLFDIETFLDELTDALASVGTDTIRISDAGGSITVDGTITPTQTTRTNMTVMGEREDLTIFSTTIAPVGAADTEIIDAPAAGVKIKIYSLNYWIDTDVRAGFRFGVADPRFAVRTTAGTYAQTYTHPIVGPAATKLSFRTEGAANVEVTVQYAEET